jgi:hypothetical protein
MYMRQSLQFSVYFFCNFLQHKLIKTDEAKNIKLIFHQKKRRTQMKHNKLKLIMALMLVLMLNELQAQETITAAGGNALGSGGSASYSVGQVTYTTNTGTNGSVSQGVQQAYAISEVTGIEQSKGISLECSVYPNPTQDYLILKVVNYDNVKLLYQLFDINGRPLKKQKIDGEVTTIYMEDILPGSYFLRVSDNQKEVKTFKILKR